MLQKTQAIHDKMSVLIVVIDPLIFSVPHVCTAKSINYPIPLQ